MKSFWWTLTGLGGLFLGFGLAIFAVDLRFFADAKRSPGEVVSVRVSGKGGVAPDVAYTDDLGRARVFHSPHFSKPSYAVGDRVTIGYDPRDPDNAAIDSFFDRHLLPTTACGIGLIPFTVGVLGLRRRSRRKREIAWLLREGQRAEATVATVTRDTSIRINREHPWVIRVEARLPGDAAPRPFVSRRFLYDPTPYLGRTLAVCFDPRAPERHVVDTGDLDPRRAASPRQR